MDDTADGLIQLVGGSGDFEDQAGADGSESVCMGHSLIPQTQTHTHFVRSKMS